MDDFTTQFVPDADIIWKMKFDNIRIEAESVPENLSLSPTVQLEPCYDYAVAWARTMFIKLCPDDEWMPPMPDPQDIIIEPSN